MFNANYQSSNNTSVIKNNRITDEQLFQQYSVLEFEQNDLKSRHGTSKISTFKNALISMSTLNKKLESTIKEVENNLELSDLEWEEKMQICSATKLEICSMLSQLKDEQLMNLVKRNVEKRKRKRLREKNRKVKWKDEKSGLVEKRSRLDAEANLWIRNKQVVIEKEKQEESLRRHADIILSDVRGKRNDAKKFLAVLQGLQSLRNVKTTIATARGESVSSTANEVFNNIIVKLKEQWSALDREYSLEEQGLKLMLKTDNEQKMQNQKKNILENWEKILFGSSLTTSENLNDFLMTRSAWDRYISSDLDASPMPIGWVMPDEPSSAAWQKSLKN